MNQVSLNLDILKYFAQYIEKELGIVYSEHNYFQLQNRLEEISKALSFSDPMVLMKTVEKSLLMNNLDPHIKNLILDTATNNETSFFRDPTSYNAFEETILKNWKKLVKPGEKLRIWSAASSSGQEALSLAMKIMEFNDINKSDIDFSIFGSDICDRILARAQTGTYGSMDIKRGLTDELKKKYFDEISSTTGIDKILWKAKANLVKNIQYQKVNLKSDFYHAQKFHVIYCRNVLIYQTIDSKKKIIERLAEFLMPQGYLVLGAGESLMGVSTNFQQINSCQSILYQKK
jgi:chemotaxis protein methyltransferase CheR